MNRTYFVANQNAPDHLTQNLLIVLAIVVTVTLGVLILLQVFGSGSDTITVREFVERGGVPK